MSHRWGQIGWPGRIGLGLLAGLIVIALAAPLIAPYEPSARVTTPFAPPSGAHLLGANDVGYDLLSGLLYGARTSLFVGFVIAAISVGLGTLVGVVSATLGGWVDALLMRVTDVALTLPLLPLVVTVAAFIGRGTLMLIVVLSALMWMRPARILRAQVLTTQTRGHVRAARAMGAGMWRVMIRHIGYAVAPLIIPIFVRAAIMAVMIEASLAFLGLGSTLGTSWGTTLYWANARGVALTDAWLWWVLPPGAAIAALVIALGLIGVEAEERIDPSLRDTRRSAVRN